MIVQCPDCTTRYELDPDRVPRARIRVRCPKCRYVFPVDGTMADVTPIPASVVEVAPEESPRAEAPGLDIARDRYEAPSARVESAPMPGLDSPAPKADEFERTPAFDLEIERPSAAARSEAARAPRPAAPAPEAATTTATVDRAPSARTPSAPTPSPAAPTNPTDQKARRLARALVSDILVYNRDLRDKSLAEGNLVQALGQEIKKSWELYKEKVTPEVANQSNHFREALNDILADGQKIF